MPNRFPTARAANVNHNVLSTEARKEVQAVKALEATLDVNTHVCRSCGRRYGMGHDVACSRGGYEAVTSTWRIGGMGEPAYTCTWVGWAEDLARFTAEHMAAKGVSASVAFTQVG